MSDNESLHFVSSIDLQTLRADVAKIEQSLRGITSTAHAEARKFDDTYKKLTQVVAGYFTLAFGAQLAGNVATVTGEFQKYEAVLTNSLGSSKEAADSMKMIAEFAAATPFSLAELTGSYVKLVNQGFKPTREEMTKMADLSASVGKDFGMLTEAIIDAQTGEFERLKEFGIRASKEGDKVTFSFKGVETQVGFTAKNIQNYILSLGELNGVAGSTAAISKTIEGQISNLGDAIGQMYADLGQDNEGLISGTLSGITSLVQNYETVLKVLESMVVAYGAYRTAVIISSLTMKGLTIAENLHLIALMAKEYALKAVTAAQLMFNKAAMMNPLGLILGSLVAVTGALLIFGNKTKEVSLAQESSARASESAATAFAKQKGSVELLLKSIHDQTLTEKQRLDAINKLKETIPGYNAELSKEGKLINENTQAIKDYLEQLEIQMLQQAIQSELQDLVTKRIVATRELTKATKAYNAEVEKNKVFTQNVVGGGDAGITGLTEALSRNAKRKQAEEEAKRNLEEVNAAIVSLEGEFSQASQDIAQLLSKSKVAVSAPQTVAEIDKKIKELRDAQLSAKVRSEYDALESEILEWEAKKEKITGKKAEKEQSKEVKDKAKEEIEALKEEIAEKKDLYGEDLIAYRSYLDEKAKSVKGKEQKEVVSDEQRSNDKAIKNQLDSLLEKYRTYEEQRAAISEEFAKERGLLGNNQSAIDENKKAEKEKLAELERNHLKETKSYRYLFDNIDRLSANALKQRIARLNEDLKATSATVEEKLAMEKALAEATDMLTSKAPFAALTEYRRRVNELKKQIDNEKDDAKKLQLQKELDDTTQKQGVAISSAFSDVSQHLSESTELAGYLGKELQEVVSTASQVASAIGKIASGDKVGGIIQIIGVLAQANDKWQNKQEAKAEEERQDRIKRSNELVAEANQLYSEQLDLLSRIKGVQLYGSLEDTSDTLLASLKEVNDAVENLYIKDRTKYHDDWEWSRSGVAGFSYGKKRKYDDYDFSKLNSAMETALKDPTFENTEAAKDQIAEINKLIGKWGDGYDTTIFGDTEELKKQLEVYKEMLKKAEELAALRIEKLTGSTTDSMVDALSSGFDDGVFSAEEFADTFEGLMKKAILESLKINYLDAQMKIWSSHFADAMSDGVLTEDEAEALNKEMQKIKDDAAAGLDAINQAGIDMLGDAGSKAEGLSGAIKGMSQESADLMAGQLGAMRIHLADIAAAITGTFNSDLKSAWQTPTDMLSSTLGSGIATMNDNLALMRETGIRANDILMSIELNTRQIADVKNVLIDIKNSGSLKGYSEGFKDDRISGR